MDDRFKELVISEAAGAMAECSREIGLVPEVQSFDHGAERGILMMWQTGKITRTIHVVTGKEYLEVEAYAWIDGAVMRQWASKSIERVPCTESMGYDWRPFLKLTIKSAYQEVTGWKEDKLDMSSPILTPYSPRDMEVGMMPSSKQHRIRRAHMPKKLPGMIYVALMLAVGMFALAAFTPYTVTKIAMLCSFIGMMLLVLMYVRSTIRKLTGQAPYEDETRRV